VKDDLALQAGKPTAAEAPELARRRWLPPVLLVLALLAAWELLKALFRIPDYKLPHVWDVLAQFGVRTQGGSGPPWGVIMLRNAAITFGEALTGFALGGMLGVLLAVLFASSRLLERGCLPFVVGSQLVPILAIAPMVVIGLGVLRVSAWFSIATIAAYLTFFPVTIGMLRGLRAVPPDALALMRSYAATSGQVFWKLRMPAALPYLFTSLKIAATASVIGAIVGELPSGTPNGIGPMIVNAAQYYNSSPPNLWATVLAASLIGLLFYGLVALVEWLAVHGRAGHDDTMT
jgi:NitT/TauT family transport system permease protein